MDWKILIVSVLFAISTCAVVPQNLKPNFSNLIAPPKLIVYQGSAHAVFDMGGMKYLYKVIGEPNAYPQCDVIQKKGKEIKNWQVEIKKLSKNLDESEMEEFIIDRSKSPQEIETQIDRSAEKFQELEQKIRFHCH